MFHSFKEDFRQKDLTFINLNNGTMALCPDSVIESQIAFIREFEQNTTVGLGHAWNHLWRIHERLGLFLNSAPQDLFLRPNVTVAFNEVLMGLKLPPGAEILTTDFEYGAILRSLELKAQKDRLKLRNLDFSFIYDLQNEEQFVRHIVDALSPQTRLFVVSHIFTGNGIEIPLLKLSEELLKKDVLMLVDGAHAPGLIPLDFSLFKDLAFYAGNLHKWAMGPKGTGFAWVNPRFQMILEPAFGSWTTSGSQAPSMGPFLNHPFALKFLWSHSQCFSSFFALEKCFDFWNHHGAAFIRQQIKIRTQFLEQSLSQRGFHKSSSIFESHFLCYPLEKFKNQPIRLMITQQNISVQVGLPQLPGSPLLRLTPHIRNEESELEQALKVLF